jgi:hypothetical protein
MTSASLRQAVSARTSLCCPGPAWRRWPPSERAASVTAETAEEPVRTVNAEVVLAAKPGASDSAAIRC